MQPKFNFTDIVIERLKLGEMFLLNDVYYKMGNVSEIVGVELDKNLNLIPKTVSFYKGTVVKLCKPLVKAMDISFGKRFSVNGYVFTRIKPSDLSNNGMIYAINRDFATKHFLLDDMVVEEND